MPRKKSAYQPVWDALWDIQNHLATAKAHIITMDDGFKVPTTGKHAAVFRRLTRISMQVAEAKGDILNLDKTLRPNTKPERKTNAR